MNDLKRELQNTVEIFVGRNFNMIQLEVFNKMSDNMLFEYIKQSDVDKTNFLFDYNLWDEFIEYYIGINALSFDDKDQYLKDASNNITDFESDLIDFCENEKVGQWESYKDDQFNSNYPMWNTLFEWKNEPSKEWIEAGEKSGFGVIEDLDFFNTTFFNTGCGYSFMAHHWIPLYLEIFEDEKVKYQSVDYSDL